MTTANADLTKIEIEKPSLDLRSVRVQLPIGIILCTFFIFVAIGFFWAIPFTRADYLSLGSSVIINPTVASYEPSTSISANLLALTELIFRHHGWLYRLNSAALILTAGVFLSLFVLDITNRYGTKIGASTALWSFLLFVISVDQARCLVSISSVDTLASVALALIALFLDSRFRLLRESWYYWLAFACIQAALAVDSVGFVLGITGIALARLVLMHSAESSKTSSTRITEMALYLVPALVYMGLHGCRLPTGSSEMPFTPFGQIWTESLGLGTTHAKQCIRLLNVAYLSIAGLTVLRLLAGTLWFRPIVFSVSWTAVCMAFSCLGWGADKLTILSCAPLAALLPLAALPGIDAMSKTPARLFTLLGSVMLSIVFVGHGMLTLSYLNGVRTPALELKFLRERLHAILEKRTEPVAYFADELLPLPTLSEYCDTRQLAQKRKPTSDLWQVTSGILCVIDPEIISRVPAEVDMWHGVPVIGKVRGETVSFSKLLRWSSTKHDFEPVNYRGEQSFDFTVTHELFNSLETVPSSVVRLSPDKWTDMKGASALEWSDNALRIVPGADETLTVWLPPLDVDPTKIREVLLNAELIGSENNKDIIDSQLRLRWQGSSEGVPSRSLPFARSSKENDVLVASTVNRPEWLQHDTIKRVGLQCPSGSYSIVLRRIGSR